MMSYLWICARFGHLISNLCGFKNAQYHQCVASLVMAMAMAPGVYFNAPLQAAGRPCLFGSQLLWSPLRYRFFRGFWGLLGITGVFLHGFCHVFPSTGTRSRGLRTWLGPPWASNSSEHLMASPRWGFHICNGDHGGYDGDTMGIYMDIKLYLYLFLPLSPSLKQLEVIQ